jgi:hypothetical protein
MAHEHDWPPLLTQLLLLLLPLVLLLLLLLALQAWKMGMTGYPLIDAAMKQLWSTGWMHNRCDCCCCFLSYFIDQFGF